MNYPLRSKKKQKFPWKVSVIAGVFILISFFAYLFPNFVRNTSVTMAQPLWVMGDAVFSPFSKIKDYFSFKSSLISKNLALQDQISVLNLKQVDYDAILKENQDFKDELGRNMSSSKIVSRILSKPPQSPYDTIVVDAGSNHGVVVGSKVYISDTIIIGKITNITPNTSLVRMFSSSGQKQDAVSSRTGATFVLNGSGGANLSVDVPKDTDILWGDTFLYPGLSTSVIGSVYYIDTNSQSSFKTIYIRIPGNVFQSKYVYINK